MTGAISDGWRQPKTCKAIRKQQRRTTIDQRIFKRKKKKQHNTNPHKEKKEIKKKFDQNIIILNFLSFLFFRHKKIKYWNELIWRQLLLCWGGKNKTLTIFSAICGRSWQRICAAIYRRCRRLGRRGAVIYRRLNQLRRRWIHAVGAAI